LRNREKETQITVQEIDDDEIYRRYEILSLYFQDIRVLV